MKDKFTIKAQKQGYKARSVFKLEDLNRKYKLIKKNQQILDLGCWPGSWSQYCKRILGNTGLILSDLAPKTTGIQDSEYSMDLAKQAFYVSSKLLRVNGNFVVKVFQGKDLNKFIDKLKSKFRFVKSTKPLASKKTS